MSYTHLLYHIVFRTKRSQKVIVEEHERELYRYMYGFIRGKGCLLYRINGMPDHIHLLVSLPPTFCVAEFVKGLKLSSHHYLKEHKSLFPHFEDWAVGYCALTYSANECEKIRQYIIKQKEHHRVHSFAEELASLLKEQGVDYDTTYFLRD